MLSGIPTMAIEWVDFIKNSSALSDEIIANRLGQIPLTFDKKIYNLHESCKCKGKGCSRCQVKLSLKRIGPCTVYSEDLKSRNKDVKAIFEKIPIVELFEDEELEFEAIAQLGTGKEHAKWQAAVVGYKNTPIISVKVKNKKDFEKYIKVCPRHIFRVERDKLVVTNPLECNMCMQCVDASAGEIEVKADERSFVFNVESACGLAAEEVVIAAAEVMEDKIKEISKGLKKLK